MNKGVIPTEQLSEKLRARSIDLPGKRVLLSTFTDSEQEQDLTDPPNCRGVGRIRHFRRGGRSNWPQNPLPIDPAFNALGLPTADSIRAQVYQNAACNWRCWYCFVPFTHLSANEKHARWCTPSELIDWFMEEEDPPRMIDLTGGQPDLVPEWVPWMMDELQRRGLERSIYLWSDDNLSGDYFWTVLTDKEREQIRTYPMYGRVACFKGFDEGSFHFNTMAAHSEFAKQFARFRKFVDLGLDVYAYATFTTPDGKDLGKKVTAFVDRLQGIHPLLPLRTVPLEIQMYSPVEARIREEMTIAMTLQHEAIAVWNAQLRSRFSDKERRTPIHDVLLR